MTFLDIIWYATKCAAALWLFTVFAGGLLRGIWREYAVPLFKGMRKLFSGGGK